MLDILQQIEQKLKTCYPVDSRSAKVVNEVKDMIVNYREVHIEIKGPELIKIRNKKGTQ